MTLMCNHRSMLDFVTVEKYNAKISEASVFLAWLAPMDLRVTVQCRY